MKRAALVAAVVLFATTACSPEPSDADGAAAVGVDSRGETVVLPPGCEANAVVAVRIHRFTDEGRRLVAEFGVPLTDDLEALVVPTDRSRAETAGFDVTSYDDALMAALVAGEPDSTYLVAIDLIDEWKGPLREFVRIEAGPMRPDTAYTTRHTLTTDDNLQCGPNERDAWPGFFRQETMT